LEITLNGKPRTINAVANIPGLLSMLNVRPEQVAVAINGEVIRRADWPAAKVREGDVIEVVRAVGGG
jgi:sulfur carrier protein